ncbi:protein suppressor of hairy wing [Nasonia vitripennis]|uniref:C2H2-type domain-containing protein n=1 Tax=Nasonia vitripennis TaxID=7425 RepID=A0A7M7T9Y3_NASVI|nr:protein suppressor of hairy wing [Nasonia vitripennis]
MGEVIEILKVENTYLPQDGMTEVVVADLLGKNDTDGSFIIPEIIDADEVLAQNGQIIQIIGDYECVTCHRIFPSEDMLKEHLQVCREEDDDADILELGRMDDIESEEEDEDDDGQVDDPDYNADSSLSDSHSSKNNNKKVPIKPVLEGQCHCCAEDLKTAHSGGSFKCTHCDMSFKKSFSLERHLVVIHWESDSCTCNDCGSTFRDKKALDKHRYTTHVKTNKVYKCDKCDTYFSRSYHLNRHKQQSGCHGDTTNSFSCQVCNKVFTRKDNLREHLRTHAGMPQRKKKSCQLCPKQFYTNQQLIIHQRVHTGERPIECDLCPKTFLSTLAMKKHRRVHTGEKPFECKYCQKKFAARETLNRHQRTHTGEKPHVCQYCNKSFIQAAQLRAHIFHHTGENGFYCDICGKAFNRKARLTNHKKFVHEGATPFKCETCDKAFTRKEDLSKHINLHAGIKPHKCDTCGKCFAAKSSLQAHMNTHRREPPQSCAECGRAFIRQDCLMRHIRAKHRDLLEDVLGEAEKKHLQLQMFNIAYIAAEKMKTGETNILSTEELMKAITELLTILIEKETLELFGWLQSPLQDVLEAVIRRCGHEPLTADSDLSLPDRLRGNVKLLFNAVIEDENVKSLLTTQTVDEVIMHVLKISQTNNKEAEEKQ